MNKFAKMILITKITKRIVITYHKQKYLSFRYLNNNKNLIKKTL